MRLASESQFRHDTICIPHPDAAAALFVVPRGHNRPQYAQDCFRSARWAVNVVGEYSCPGSTVTTGLPFFTPAQAAAEGARALVIGVANEGGFIDDRWLPAFSAHCKLV